LARPEKLGKNDTTLGERPTIRGATFVTDDSTSQATARNYRVLGLMVNPFTIGGEPGDSTDLATASEGNRLLSELEVAAEQAKPKPITVIKHPIPSQYPLNAVAAAEHVLCNDDEFNVLHAYVPLFVMHTGRIRSTLAVLSERLAFRSFDRTLAKYVGQVLAQTDSELISFQVLGQDRLEQFAARFADDSAAAIESVFGTAELERRPELAEVNDLRVTQLEDDGVEDENTGELDSSVGDAPGTEVILAEDADVLGRDEANDAVLDYLVEYTRIHLSPVIGRALRVYRERGLAAMASEFRVTKAPRKTLSALVRLARVRFRKIALIYDGFGNWGSVPPATRTQITAALSELRWMLDGDAVMVLLLEQDGVPELEEQFGAGVRLDWTFEDVREIAAEPDRLGLVMVDGWLAAATLPGYEAMTTADAVIRSLVETASGSLGRFIPMAARAIDDAAERCVDSLDSEAERAGLLADPGEAPGE
jgi:hypothetical protein